MLSRSSQLVCRRVVTAFRLSGVRPLHSTKLDKILDASNAGNGFHQRLSRLETLIRGGRIAINDLNGCVNELSKSQSIRPTTTQSLLLIRSCSAIATEETPEKRREVCQRVFDTLSQVSDLDISHYNQLLRVFSENKLDFDAINFLERMQSKGIEPNRVTYMLIIDWFCQKGNIAEAIRILEHMKSNDMAINESVFNSLIVGYGKIGDIATSEQTLEMLSSSGGEPSSETYTALLCAYAHNIKTTGIEQKLIALLDKLASLEVELSESQLFSLVESLALADADPALIDKVLNLIPMSTNYNNHCLPVINNLIFAHKVEYALRLYETMQLSEKMVGRRSAGNPLIKSMVRANVPPEKVISICEVFQTSGANESAIKLATEMALAYSDIDVCRAYLKRFSADNPLKTHYFYPLIVKCKDENEIIDVLSRDMTPFTTASYSELSELFSDYVWPKRILDVHSFIDRCKQIGFSVTVTYHALLRHYIDNSLFAEVIQLLRSPVYSSVNLIRRDVINELTEAAFRANPKIEDIVKILEIVHSKQRVNTRQTESGLSDTFGQYLLTLIRKRIGANQMQQFLEAFDRVSARVSETSATAIRDRLVLNEKNNSLLTKLTTKTLDDTRKAVYHDIDDITKPRSEMTPEELEGHLIELRSKGLNTRGVLRSLLMAYCRRTRFTNESQPSVQALEARARVQQIVADLQESNFEFSDAMKAMLMDFYVNTGDLQLALEMKSNISNDFEIDFYKIINLATLYVKNGQIEKGIELIKNENKLKSDAIEAEEVDQSPQLSRTRDTSIYRLLNCLVEANADIELIKDVLALCLNYSSLVPTSSMVGPIIKHLIEKGDFAGALDTFEEMADKHRITPWKNQLLKHFLKAGDQTSLQRVVDCSNKCHGEMNTIIELAAICVELGKVKQAKKLLDTPGLRVKDPKIDSICEHFIRENDIEGFEQFIRVSKNLFDVNRDRMLYNLIRGYIKLNAPDKALNAWTLMQEENIQPTDRTLRLLADFLQQNNVTVPFAVPPEPVITADRPSASAQSERSQSEQVVGSDDPLHKFNVALKKLDIDEALRIKKSFESKGNMLLMSQNCSLIEALLNADRIDEAFDISKSLITSKLFPSPRIIRYLYTKLSSTGDCSRLEELQTLLPQFLVQNNSFSNALMFAYINSGKTEQIVDRLPQMKPFPLGGFLKALEVRPDLEQRLIRVANDLIAAQDYHLPLNMIWINMMANERYEDAQQIYDSCPKLKDFLLFSTLLDSIRENRNEILAKKLIETVSNSNLTPKSVGVTYSSLIDVYIESGKVKEAEEFVVNEVVNATKTRIDPKTKLEVRLSVDHLNRSTLKRLVNAIRSQEQREPKFSTTTQTASSSSSDEDLSDSSDEEVVKNK